MGKGTDMSKCVLKDRLTYDDAIGDTATIHIDVEAKVLCVQMQDGKPTVWYESERAPLQTGNRSFYILPTGLADVPEDGAYIGTVQDANGGVWHIYEKIVVE